MKTQNIEIGFANSKEDLVQIYKLQKKNLKKHLSKKEVKQEGFVTVNHDQALLAKMNVPHPHIIAKVDQVVIGYCLVMLSNLKSAIPILTPMFDQIDRVFLHEKSVAHKRYFVMGQVCIDKKYRARGIFYKMYDYMKVNMSHNFDCVITEVSKQNPRSLKAHYNQGFQLLHSYTSPDEHPWEIIIWDWQKGSS